MKIAVFQLRNPFFDIYKWEKVGAEKQNVENLSILWPAYANERIFSTWTAKRRLSAVVTGRRFRVAKFLP